MSIELLLATVLPIVLFVVAEVKYGVKAGVYAAMVAALLLGVYLYIRLEEIDPLFAVEFGLIFGLGAVAIKFQNSKYFKFQPAIVGVIGFCYMIGFQIFDTPVLIRLLPAMQKLAPEGALEQFNSPIMMELLSNLSWLTGILFLVHGLFCGWAAVKLTSTGWLLVRLAVYPAMIFTILLANLITFAAN